MTDPVVNATLPIDGENFSTAITEFNFRIDPQPTFNKNFDLLIRNLTINTKNGVQNLIFSETPSQLKRLYAIFDDIQATDGSSRQFDFDTINISLHLL